jgi:hypothetical protein
MTNEQYKALWNRADGSRTFVVVDAANDMDVGSIITSSFEEAKLLLNRAIKNGTYPNSSILIELVSDPFSN